MEHRAIPVFQDTAAKEGYYTIALMTQFPLLKSSKASFPHDFFCDMICFGPQNLSHNVYLRHELEIHPYSFYLSLHNAYAAEPAEIRLLRRSLNFLFKKKSLPWNLVLSVVLDLTDFGKFNFQFPYHHRQFVFLPIKL